MLLQIDRDYTKSLQKTAFQQSFFCYCRSNARQGIKNETGHGIFVIDLLTGSWPIARCPIHARLRLMALPGWPDLCPVVGHWVKTLCQRT
jgi:hypothetical protein